MPTWHAGEPHGAANPDDKLLYKGKHNGPIRAHAPRSATWFVDASRPVVAASCTPIPVLTTIGLSEALDSGEVPAMGAPMQGLPVPKEARLLSRTPQALTLTSSLDRNAILRFYAHHGSSWGAITQHAQGLQFAGANTPVSFVSVSPMPGGFMISLMRTGQDVADEPAVTNDTFGVPLPPSAEEYMRTADTLIVQVPGGPAPVFAFYRERFAADRELSLMQVPTPQGDYMLIGAENARRSFRFVSITVTPESLRAGGPSTQITIQAAK